MLGSLSERRQELRPRGLPRWLLLPLPGLVVALIGIRMMMPVKDPDTFWHLATGDFLTRTWQFSGPDPWSAQSSQTWRLHEWLPELLMHGLYRLAGMAAVAWLLPLGAVSILTALTFMVRRWASLLPAALVVLVAFIGMSASMTLRPQLVTFLLSIVVTGAWLRTADDLKARWGLVPLAWLWACCHGMWFVGPVIGVVVVVGMMLDRRVTFRHGLTLVLIPVASVVVAALTPVGPGLLLAPLKVDETTRYITEWQPASIHMLAFDAFLLMVAVTVLVWVRQAVRVPWVDLLMVGLGVGFALMYGRTIPLGVVLIAPSAARAIQALLGREREPITKREISVTVGLAATALMIAAVLAPVRAGVATASASDLDAALGHLPQGTEVCNDYALGGWLIWAHPNVRPVIDGRSEIYSFEYFTAYEKFLLAAPGWEAFPARVGCSYALLEKDSVTAYNLVRHAGWVAVARGQQDVLLEGPAGSGSSASP